MYTISLLRATFAVALLLLGMCETAQADPAYNPTIRIKLSRFYPIGTGEVDVTCSGPFEISDNSGSSVVEAPSGTVYHFVDQAGTRVAVDSFAQAADPEDSESDASMSALSYNVHAAAGTTITVTADTPGAIAHHYRGDIVISPGLSVVNDLPLEDYIKGVLKPEIGASAPLEALKAQAIAARTYTVRNLGKMAESNADMDDTTRTQSYVGVDGETPTIDEAVDDTAGEVLLYKGQLINAVYSTDCGGETATGNATEPYLSPVSDPECAQEPPWEVDLSVDDVAKLFALPGTSGAITLKSSGVDSSGRVTNIEIRQGDLSQKITGNQFRRLVGVDKVRSTLFTVARRTDGSIAVTGQGWGHGLGMCQHGAIYLANHAAQCDDILTHYYTGTTIDQLTPEMLPSQPLGQIMNVPPDISSQIGP